jgi:D-3-phosphoglycerate dehydrogenase
MAESDFKILVADAFEAAALEELCRKYSVLYQPNVSGDELKQQVLKFEPEVLVVRSTRFADLLDSKGPVKWVIRGGSGVNPADMEAAKKHKVSVSNCPGMNAQAVAELAVGLMLAADRKLYEAVSAAKAGKFAKKELKSHALGLSGRSLGLLGFGNISQAVARLGRAMNMHVLAWVRNKQKYSAEAVELGVVLTENLLDLAPNSDVVSVHIPFDGSNENLLGEEFFAQMKKGAMFVNTARAELVDEAALLKAVEDRSIRVALDLVKGTEPKDNKTVWESPLLKSESVIVSPHLGASTAQAQEATCAEVVRLISDFVETGQRHNLLC